MSHKVSYLTECSTILFEKIKTMIPIIIKTIPKIMNVIVVEAIVGTGLHALSFYYLKFELRRASYY